MDADALLHEVRMLVNDFIGTVAIWTYLCEVPAIGAFNCHTVEHEKSVTNILFVLSVLFVFVDTHCVFVTVIWERTCSLIAK